MFKTIATILWKDLKIELRTKEALSASFVFSVLLHYATIFCSISGPLIFIVFCFILWHQASYSKSYSYTYCPTSNAVALGPTWMFIEAKTGHGIRRI